MRDWMCIKNVLIELEQGRSVTQQIADLIFNGKCDDASNYLEMLEGVKLIRKDNNVYARSKHEAYIYRLTWLGYELLDKIRCNSVWSEVTRLASEKGLPINTNLIDVAIKNILEKK